MYHYRINDLIADRYLITAQIGEGGTSQVYRVIDQWLEDDQVALKLILPAPGNDPSYNLRIRNEVLLARRLGHPNIVRVYDYGYTSQDESYITMEFVCGETLLDYYLKQPQGRLSLFQTQQVLLPLVTAIEFAHQQNVVHRDIKPENIFLTKDGHCKLGDFGAAKAIGGGRQLTRSGHVIGTLSYMAPEQLAQLPLDARVDIYALGLVVYEMTTGVPACESECDVASAVIKAQHQFRLLEQHPWWFQNFIETCTEVSPENRYQNMAEVREVILSWSLNESHVSLQTVVENIPKIQRSFFQRITQTLRLN